MVSKKWWQSWKKAGMEYELNDCLDEAEECYSRAGSPADIERVRRKRTERRTSSAPKSSAAAAAAAAPQEGVAVEPGKLQPFTFDVVAEMLGDEGYEANKRSDIAWYFKKEGEIGFVLVLQKDEITQQPTYLVVLSTFSLEDELADDLMERSRIMDILNYNCSSFHVCTDEDNDVLITSACPVSDGFHPGHLNQLLVERRKEMDKHQSLLWKLVK